MFGYNTGSSGMNNQHAGGSVNIGQNSFGNSIVGNIGIGNVDQTGGVQGSGGSNNQSFSLDMSQPAGASDAKKEAGGDAKPEAAASKPAELTKLAPLEPMSLQNMMMTQNLVFDPFYGYLVVLI